MSSIYENVLLGTILSTTAAGRTISQNYDPSNALLQSTQINGLLASSYNYDSRGRLVDTTTGTRTTQYSYNTSGNLASVENAAGDLTSFGYDDLGRLNQVNYPDGGTLTQSYDANGNLIELAPPGQPVHRFSYNGVNINDEYDPPSVTGATAPETLYNYDRDRKLTRITRPDGQQLNLGYRTFTDQLISLDIPRGTYHYSYDSHGKITSVQSPQGDSLNYSYDGALLASQSWNGTIDGTVSNASMAATA